MLPLGSALAAFLAVVAGGAQVASGQDRFAGSGLEALRPLVGPTRLSALDGDAHWFFGDSLALSPRHLAVGASWAHSGDGVVYLYERGRPSRGRPPQLSLVANLLGAGGDERRFGLRLDLCVDILAVGASVGGRGAGVVVLYDLDTLQPIVRIPSPDRAAFFPGSIDCIDDMLIVGTPRADNEVGAVFVYHRPAEGWSALDPSQFSKLVPPEPQGSNRFGTSVAIDGDEMLVGAPLYETAEGTGVVFVFDAPAPESVGTSQTPGAVLVGPSESRFGSWVSRSLNLLVVTAPNARNAEGEMVGSVLVYSRPPTGWSVPPAEPLAVLQATDAVRRTAFAANAAAVPGAILVGAPGDPVGGFARPGAVYVFREPVGGWSDHPGVEDRKIQSPPATRDDRFGFSLAADAVALFVGAPSEPDEGDHHRGVVWAYTFGALSPLEIPTIGRVGAVLLALALVLLGGRAIRHDSEAT